MTGQASLGDFTEDDLDTLIEEVRSRRQDPASPASMGDAPESLRDPKTLLSKQATTDEPSCPWCLHPESEFEPSPYEGKLTCPACHTPVPVEAEWYQRGEKVCL